MAGGDWRGFALEEAEFLSGRLKDLLSSGQAYVGSHLGLDLGMKPELFPTWLILTTATVSALLLLAVTWAAVCGGGGRRRKRSILVVTPSGRGDGHPVAKTTVTKMVKLEETKKRHSKKGGEKKLQPNGQPAAAAVLVQQEVKAPRLHPDVLRKLHLPSIKTRKAPNAQLPAQVKKDQKKRKTSVKLAQQVIAHDGKETDEGAWETKVSNREKKQQRRKEKGAEPLSGSEVTHPAKGHVDSTSNVKKKKNRAANEFQNSKSAAKGGNGVNGGSRTDFSAKVPPTQTGFTETSKWGAPYCTRTEPRSWAQESQGANMKSDLDPASLSVLRLNAAAEPLSKCMEPQLMHHADDEWAGMKGEDAGTDWNAPVEHWGNYEEPPVARERTPANKASAGEKESEDPAGGAGKPKKKRKKKTSEEAAQDGEQNLSLGPQVTPFSFLQLARHVQWEMFDLLQGGKKEDISSVMHRPERMFLLPEGNWTSSSLTFSSVCCLSCGWKAIKGFWSKHTKTKLDKMDAHETEPVMGPARRC
ncbi:protein LYRIC-like isoform X3 [Syngnathus acus]|uniref:protein LYRIC-like isoform X3 n=1 Tax=Syngnathus acus TaxID=161584 RepID=UPI001885D18A|nr:protein LYRIC-like isoform X3 [Syngnathus acus]